MSRIAGCSLALGFCVTLATGCGDDDLAGVGLGGSGGAAGRASNAGAAGSGRGGAGGRVGTGGVSGVAGAGGTGGSAGLGNMGGGASGESGAPGTGGISGSGGTGGGDSVVVPPDAGLPDASEPDPDPILDAGPNGDCPNFDTAAAGIVREIDGQAVVISRVVFADGDATVFFRGVSTGYPFDFSPEMRLCAGPDNCLVDEVQELDDADDTLQFGQEVSVAVSGLSPAGGELAFINNEPAVDDIVWAYIAWGTFVSPEFANTDGGLRSLEDRAVITERWTDGDRIVVGSANTIYIHGITNREDGFSACTGD